MRKTYLSCSLGVFFSSIGSLLASNIHSMKSNDPVVDYMPYNNKSSIYLFPCTNVEIENIVRDLSNTKAIGLDGFSMKIIKSIISNICVPLSKSFNSSLIAGIFPDSLKHAKVIPVFKCNDKSIINNYRSISVLPIFSKVLRNLCITVFYH